MTSDVRTAYVGATLVDATGAPPIKDATIIVEDKRFVHVSGPMPGHDLGENIAIVDLSGTHIVPGLMDANVHTVIHLDPDILLRYPAGEYDPLVLEATQVALRAGVTTVFDTWGPLESLRRVRDAIREGEAVGSRLLVAGNMIGNDGPWSNDYFPQVAQGLASEVVDEVNSHWEQAVGARLTWMPSDGVRAAVRKYLAESEVDFVKFASSSHAHSRFLALSLDSQRAVVEEAHAAGLTAQACTLAPEALKTSIEAGVDIIQHADMTGLYPMPDDVLGRIVSSQIPVTAFLFTQRHTDAFIASKPTWHGNDWGQVMRVKAKNDSRLIESGAKILLANDMGVYGQTAATSPMWGPFQTGIPDIPTHLGTGHVLWLRAAMEQGMSGMDALQCATRNIAEAYGVDSDLGTVEVGKLADFVVLDGDPMSDVDSYERVLSVTKEGRPIDIAGLPNSPVLTADRWAR